ncbi:hypothetical protein [Flavobacterium pisciphilum]|uniref:hypothetical protein n=1 Tax=Flavobacterium pisciphilum TaxID=2893755 RepID=UPI003D186E76
MDIHNQEQCSKTYVSLKNTATKVKVSLAKALRILGYRYRKKITKQFSVNQTLSLKKNKAVIL